MTRYHAMFVRIMLLDRMGNFADHFTDENHSILGMAARALFTICLVVMVHY